MELTGRTEGYGNSGMVGRVAAMKLKYCPRIAVNSEAKANGGSLGMLG
jgi:hypothetical protein